MKRILLSLVLILALLMPGWSCAEAPAGYEAYDEPITITVGKKVNANPSFADAADTQENNEMTRIIKDVLNIDVKLAWESDEYDTKLAMSIISQDLPDVFVVNDRLVYQQLVENNLLADLSEAYDTYASQYIRDVMESYGNQTLVRDEEGHLYGIGQGNIYYNNHSMLWLRKDWLDALNLEAPTTLEEVEQVLIAFRDHYGSKGLLVDGSNPFGGAGAFYSLYQLASAFGAYPDTWVAGEDGRAVYGSVMPGMKDALEVMARWYAEGLIDPEFAVRGHDEVSALFASGESGAVFAPWSLPYQITDLMNTEGAELIMCNAPVNADGTFTLLNALPYSSMLCVSAKCEHPEAAIKMLSLEFDAYLGYYAEGFERLSADITNNASWAALFPTGTVNMAYSYRLLEYYECIRELLDNQGVFPDPDKYGASMQKNAFDVYNYANGDKSVVNGWIGYYGRVMTADLFNADNIRLMFPVFDGTTESMSDLWASLESLELQTFLSIVTGQKPVEEFDSFVTQWYSQGGDIVTEEVNEAIGK